MEVIHPELRKAISDLDLAEESRDLLLQALIEEGKTLAPNNALGLLRLLENLRLGGFLRLVPLQKTQLLENLITLIRREHKQLVGRVCYFLYEGNLPPQRTFSLLPERAIRDLLKWVNVEKTGKVRESLWVILLRKEMGLASFAKIADVAPGLFEQDSIIRNNVICFLFDHFPPDEVAESLLQFSMTSGKRIPVLVFKRYASLLKDREDLQQKKYILERILSIAKLGDKEIDQIFSDYMNSLNRFDLVTLLSSSAGSPPRIADLRGKGRQMGFPFDHEKTTSPHHDSFRQRICLLNQV